MSDGFNDRSTVIVTKEDNLPAIVLDRGSRLHDVSENLRWLGKEIDRSVDSLGDRFVDIEDIWENILSSEQTSKRSSAFSS